MKNRQVGQVTRANPRPTPIDLGELLADLGRIYGPPGREDEVRRRVIRQIGKRADRLEISPLGAVHAIYGSGHQPRLMIAAHMDEVGVIVSHVDSSGFARFGLLGHKVPASLVGHAVRFPEGQVGVIRADSKLAQGELTTDRLFLDFGHPDKARVTIKVGDVGSIESGEHRLGDRFARSNAGGRSGLAVLIGAMPSVKRPVGEIQFVFSVQGEFGGDGGLTSASALGPQSAIMVSPAPSEESPGNPTQPIRLGGGPVFVVRHGSTMSDPHLIESAVSLADRLKIKYQSATLEGVLPGAGIPAVLGGVKTAWIAVPCRGLGTTAEMVDLGDIGGTMKLVAALAQSPQEWV